VIGTRHRQRQQQQQQHACILCTLPTSVTITIRNQQSKL
jgi:hypothetical protein